MSLDEGRAMQAVQGGRPIGGGPSSLPRKQSSGRAVFVVNQSYVNGDDRVFGGVFFANGSLVNGADLVTPRPTASLFRVGISYVNGKDLVKYE